jgi:hypothetical protein
MKRRLILLAVLGLVLTEGCTRRIASSQMPVPTVGTAPAPTPPTPPAVDGSIQPVSASQPSAEAKAALEACGVYDLGLEMVAGMGRLSQGKDAIRFGLSANAPQLQTQSPVWVIQLRGEVPQLRIGQIWIDPICTVIDGAPGFYAAGPIRDLETRQIVRGYWPEPPMASLPSLAP